MVKKDCGICQIKYWYNNDMKLSEKSWLHDFSELITILDHYVFIWQCYIFITIDVGHYYHADPFGFYVDSFNNFDGNTLLQAEERHIYGTFSLICGMKLLQTYLWSVLIIHPLMDERFEPNTQIFKNIYEDRNKIRFEYHSFTKEDNSFEIFCSYGISVVLLPNM